MGFRFLFVGDVHLRDSDPQNRVPGYREQILTKLQECQRIAEDNLVDFVVFAGDIFHFKEPYRTSHKLVKETMGILQSFGCPRYVCVGNHDLTADRLDGLGKQPLGSLIQSEAFTKINEMTIGCVWLGFQHYDVGYEKVDTYKPFGLGVEYSYRVLFTHGSLIPDSYRFLGPCTRYKQVVNSGLDLVCNGHIHDDLGVKRMSKTRTIFACPGSLSRGSIHEYNLNRQVNVLLVSLEERDDSCIPKFRTIPITSARPSSEVFLIEQIQEKRDHQEAIEDFTRRLSEEAGDELELKSLDSVFSNYCVVSDVPSEVVEMARAYLEEAVAKEGR